MTVLIPTRVPRDRLAKYFDILFRSARPHGLSGMRFSMKTCATSNVAEVYFALLHYQSVHAFYVLLIFHLYLSTFPTSINHPSWNFDSELVDPKNRCDLSQQFWGKSSKRGPRCELTCEFDCFQVLTDQNRLCDAQTIIQGHQRLRRNYCDIYVAEVV